MPGPEDGKEAACLVMAGGEGRRLSPDKPLLHVEGRPIIERVVEVVRGVFDEVLIVTNTPERYAFLGLPHVEDEEPGLGPLMGIYSGLKAIGADRAFVCAADMPFLEADIIRAELAEVGDHDMVVPYPDDLPEFLHGIYRTRCLPAIEGQLKAKRYKIDLLRKILDVRVLDDAWFSERGFKHVVRRAFANINTVEDYRAWSGEGGSFPGVGSDLQERIRNVLVRDESRYQREQGTSAFSSLWSHSLRVAGIARTLAEREGVDQTAAVLSALLHDAGKFRGGLYHEGDRPEEEDAVELAGELVGDTEHEGLLPEIGSAILSMYRDDVETGRLGAVLYDADRLDKLGCTGIAQFFSKSALRGRFLDEELIRQASVELTYAYHAERNLKTRTGRELATRRASRVRAFFDDLIEEWRELGLGTFSVERAEIEGIPLVLVVPARCGCGSGYEIRTDIEDGVKCRSAVIEYVCPRCNGKRELSFCLPVLETLLEG